MHIIIIRLRAYVKLSAYCEADAYNAVISYYCDLPVRNVDKNMREDRIVDALEFEGSLMFRSDF